MTGHNKADEARKGLIDSVKGKAKEIAGAVTGNDSLTAEGQLEQTQAQERKAANSVEAVADAEAEQAKAEADAARLGSAQQRTAVNAKSDAVENSVRDQQAAQKRAAEQIGHQEEVREKSRAELDAQAKIQHAKAEERHEVAAATEEVADAAETHISVAQAASNAEAEADRIRREADKLTREADLP